MSSQSNNNRSQKGGVGIWALIIILIVGLLILLGVIAYLLFSRRKTEQNTEVIQPRNEARGMVIHSDNLDDVLDQMSDADSAVEDGYYIVTQNGEWLFPSGDRESSNAYVENDINNAHDVFFDVFINGNEEEAIYQSPVIPRGEYLQNFKLDKDLDAGTYDCVVIYHMIDENQNTLDTSRMAVTVVIES